MARITIVPKTVALVIISTLGYIFSLLSVFQFAVFLFRDAGFANQKNNSSASSADAANPYIGDLSLDFLLIGAFILQHSLMACRLWKDIVQWLGLDVVERSLYILATCGALRLLMSYWRPLSPDSVLWSFGVNSRFVWILFGLLSLVGWLCVMGPVLVLDYAELVGVKQVYYFVMDLEPPIQFKSREYQRLFKNYRHPVLTGTLIILWAVPVMTMSRLVLALSLSIYTLYGHSLDMRDYEYIYLQHRLKKRMLGTPNQHRQVRSPASVSYG